MSPVRMTYWKMNSNSTKSKDAPTIIARRTKVREKLNRNGFDVAPLKTTIVYESFASLMYLTPQATRHGPLKTQV